MSSEEAGGGRGGDGGPGCAPVGGGGGGLVLVGVQKQRSRTSRSSYPGRWYRLSKRGARKVGNSGMLMCLFVAADWGDKVEDFYRALDSIGPLGLIKYAPRLCGCVHRGIVMRNRFFGLCGCVMGECVKCVGFVVIF